MNDSTILSLVPRSRNSISIGCPNSSTMIFASGASKSIAPRRFLILTKILCNSAMSLNIGTKSA